MTTPLYPDWNTLPPQRFEQIAHQRALEIARTTYGLPTSGPDDGIIDAGLTEALNAAAGVPGAWGGDRGTFPGRAGLIVVGAGGKVNFCPNPASGIQYCDWNAVGSSAQNLLIQGPVGTPPDGWLFALIIHVLNPGAAALTMTFAPLYVNVTMTPPAHQRHTSRLFVYEAPR